MLGDTINANITLDNESSLFYNYLKKKTIKSTNRNKVDVKYYTFKGKTYETQRPVVDASTVNRFIMTKDTFTDYVVIQCKNKAKSEIYDKAILWINRAYKNPKEVILSEIKGEYIRIEAISKTAIKVYNKGLLGIGEGNLFRNAKYQIEISVKEGKYKFDVISIEEYITPSKYVVGGWTPTYFLNNQKHFYDDDGKLKEAFEETPLYITSHFNELNKSLDNFINVENKKIDDW